MVRVNRIEDGTGAARPCGLTSAPGCADGFMALRPYRALSRLQGEGVAQRRHLGAASNVEKAARKPEILEERPEVLSPSVAIEWKAPEIVEQHGGGDHVEHEQQRRLA